MPLIKNFSEITKNDTTSAGGKGASLGEMTKAGLPVPDGFVVIASVFRNFIIATGIVEVIKTEFEKLDLENSRSIEDASKKIRAHFAKTDFPVDLGQEIWAAFQKLQSEYVAVRSSATAEDSSTASWAGELETYLNTTQENLLENIKKCWSSLFTPRAIFYCLEKKFNFEQIGVAVVVQKMIQSEVSGIAFTVHPVTEDRNQMIIEAAFGLGEAVVGGLVTPDSYVISKSDMKIIEISVAQQDRKLVRNTTSHEVKNIWVEIDQQLGEKQKLDQASIFKLAVILKQIELHYGFPCDIEWAYADGQFFITQSRPITTLKI